MIPGSLNGPVNGPVKNPKEGKMAGLFLSGCHQRNA
jgi:hypothetical protein